MQLRALTWLAAAIVGACASPSTPTADERTHDVLQRSFRGQGQAGVDRLQQDALQRACSQPEPPSPAETERLQAAEAATIVWPKDGVYLGDWREGEKLAQNGRGMTWTDAPGSANGGSCYNCHQIAAGEISYGTVGPSLLGYGRLRGVTDPASPASAEVVRYTWGKLWDSKAANACSGMPRFGHVLTEAQIRDLMALLLDPKSPVNR